MLLPLYLLLLALPVRAVAPQDAAELHRLAATYSAVDDPRASETYEKAIVDLGQRSFAPGQTYVALSRISSLDGLYLSRPLRPSDIIVDENVRRFMSQAVAVPGSEA